MNALLITTGFILAFIIVLYYERKIRLHKAEPKNKVHFYVARNKNGSLYLHIGKPFRAHETFDSLMHGSSIYLNWSYMFKYLGLNKKDYINLKWEDGPVEVFIKWRIKSWKIYWH